MHLFRDETGYTIGKYITEKRLYLANHAIEQGVSVTDLSLIHISFLPAPIHSPTTFIRPMPIPMAAIPFRFSRIFVIACAAIAAVPRVDTVDWIACLLYTSRCV